MILFLQDMKARENSLEGLREVWKKDYVDLKKEEPDLSYEEYLKMDIYFDHQYFYDEENDELLKANDFFHKYNH